MLFEPCVFLCLYLCVLSKRKWKSLGVSGKMEKIVFKNLGVRKDDD